MTDDNEWELIGSFSLSIKLDLVRLELFAPMKRFLKSLDMGYPLKSTIITNASHANHLEESCLLIEISSLLKGISIRLASRAFLMRSMSSLLTLKIPSSIFAQTLMVKFNELCPKSVIPMKVGMFLSIFSIPSITSFIVLCTSSISLPYPTPQTHSMRRHAVLLLLIILELATLLLGKTAKRPSCKRKEVLKN